MTTIASGAVALQHTMSHASPTALVKAAGKIFDDGLSWAVHARSNGMATIDSTTDAAQHLRNGAELLKTVFPEAGEIATRFINDAHQAIQNPSSWGSLSLVESDLRAGKAITEAFRP